MGGGRTHTQADSHSAKATCAGVKGKEARKAAEAAAGAASGKIKWRQHMGGGVP